MAVLWGRQKAPSAWRGRDAGVQYMSFALLALSMPAALLGEHSAVADVAALGDAATAQRWEAAARFPWAQPHTELEGWHDVHAAYVRELDAARRAGEVIDLLMLGDSITECWRGTCVGRPAATPLSGAHFCAGTPSVFRRCFASRWNSVALGIADDWTDHLMWRLLHGESPAGLGVRAAVLLIGTNDLGDRFSQGAAAVLAAANGTAAHVLDIADWLLAALPDATVLVQGLLPRGLGEWEGVQPTQYRQPGPFSAAIDAVNAAVKARISARREPRLQYVSCGAALLADGGRRLDSVLVPDAIHPSARGMELMARCLLPRIEAVLGEPGPGSGACSCNVSEAANELGGTGLLRQQ